ATPAAATTRRPAASRVRSRRWTARRRPADRTGWPARRRVTVRGGGRAVRGTARPGRPAPSGPAMPCFERGGVLRPAPAPASGRPDARPRPRAKGGLGQVRTARARRPGPNTAGSTGGQASRDRWP
ncbi:hypothetical protein STREPTOSP366_62610, partial [Streptomyces variabilis]